MNSHLKDAVISQCQKLFRDAKQCDELLTAIRNAKTTAQMQRIGTQIVVRKGNEPIMDRVKRKCIEYLNNNYYMTPTDGTLVEDVVNKRRRFQLPPTALQSGSPPVNQRSSRRSSTFVNMNGSRTPTALGRRTPTSPVVFQSERKNVSSDASVAPRTFNLNHRLASSNVRRKLSFSEALVDE